MEDKELEGLEYDSLVLDHNVHKLVGNLTKLQDGKTADIPVDEKAMWLVTGLGYLNKGLVDDKILQESLDDTIIISKSKLIEFIKKNKNG